MRLRRVTESRTVPTRRLYATVAGVDDLVAVEPPASGRDRRRFDR
jgi:hypothetical protein